MKPTFQFAMWSYVVMALIAVLATEGKIRLAILILLGGLALKTCIARRLAGNRRAHWPEKKAQSGATGQSEHLGLVRLQNCCPWRFKSKYARIRASK